MDTLIAARSPDTGTGSDASDGLVTAPVPTYGVVIDPGGDLGGLYADDAGVHLFTQPRDGSPVSADLPAGAEHVAVVGIDGTGTVYGTYVLSDGSGGTSTYSFEDRAGTVTTIAGPNGSTAGTVVRSVNAAGMVLGTYTDGGSTQAFRLTSAGAAPITVDGSAPASIVSLAPIDDAGDVAGLYSDAHGKTLPFLAVRGPAGATVAVPDGYAVTSLVVGGAGAVACTLSDPSGMGSAVYLSGDDLSVVAPPGTGADVQPIGFDDGGDVVGTFTDIDCTTQSLIAYPQEDGSGMDVEPFTFDGTLPADAVLRSTQVIGTDVAGAVFGTYTYADGTGATHTAGFVYSGGQFVTLPSGTAFARPTGLDDAGDVVAALGADGLGGTLIDRRGVDRGGVVAALTVPGRVRPDASVGGAGTPDPTAGAAGGPGSQAGPTSMVEVPSAAPAAAAPAPAPTVAAAAPPAPATAFATASAPSPVPAPAADAVSLSPQVGYARGAFTLSGTATSPAGVAGVEITATLPGGAVEDLGAAALDSDGSFSFSARIGRRVLGFLTATATDRAGGTASATGTFALAGGFDRGELVGEQDVYTPGGGAVASTTRFSPQGDRVTAVYAPGQTFMSEGADTFDDGRFGDNTFVFDPGHGASVIERFRLSGARHDTLSFSGADFGGSVARLLGNSADAPDGSGVVITDPTTRDTVELAGFSKGQLVGHRGDIVFRA